MTGATVSARPAPRVVDLLLAVGVSAALVMIVALAEPVRGGAPRPLAHLFAVGFGAVLLLRRRFPVGVLVVSALGTFGYYAADLPVIGVAVPILGALYSAAEAGATRASIACGSVVLVVAQLFRLRDDPRPAGYVLGYESVANLALIGGAIALGYGVRAGRARAEQQARIAEMTREQLEREGRMQVQVERDRISRDLHDTVGHALSAITLHASVGLEALGRDDGEVRSTTPRPPGVGAADRQAPDVSDAGHALAQIRDEGARALGELRTMVRVLRAEDRRREVLSLDAIGPLVERARQAGIDVSADVVVDVAELSGPVDTAGYRVVQEALTNVLRHARARTVTVRARLAGGTLELTVADDGVGAAEVTAGYGLTGMAERLRLLGGSLTTSSAPGEGFVVVARVPARLT
ncbi:sensor histidine kinase [Georgenia sp. Z1344]|uniref:sensor histidine kinase n=1 Tax=Georgenia sp. Z1344 TaxID=3416706 RepID=UPI003CF6ADC9